LRPVELAGGYDATVSQQMFFDDAIEGSFATAGRVKLGHGVICGASSHSAADPAWR